ncbi:hypothetical protein LSH36_136g05027 [Paralvinella palmiformis]|uniref:G-protein coupled receptors family 1 profile domain-containing protein n=1 Tax=Paralvinella palmiformis TaxID=53620 RepID=A0AAD9JY47_9ANNE|nr:hypothetical protein LSH36_136g05027 [Paralvinella palmiformis]
MAIGTNGTNSNLNKPLNGKEIDVLLELSEGSVLSQLVFYLYPLISVWIVAVNGLTLTIYGRYERLQTKRNVMVISLSVVDLFAGIAQFLPKAIGRWAGGDKDFAICLTASALQIAPPWASIFHLVAIAIERHIAITKPLLYHVIVTPRRLAFAVAVSYAVASFFVLMPLAWPRDHFKGLCLSILWYPKTYRYVFFW